MNHFGYIRVAACSPEVRPADVDFNLEKIRQQISICAEQKVDLVVFPELCITGYTCADLFEQQTLIENAWRAIKQLADEIALTDLTCVVGAPVLHNDRLYNCAVVLNDGIAGIVPKSFLPNYGEFYEQRWFSPASCNTDKEYLIHKHNYPEQSFPFGTDLLFRIRNVKFGVEICEDLWVPSPPSSRLAEAGAELIVNLSATNELIDKHSYLTDLIRNQSARCRCGYIYASAGTGESSTDLAFAGNCIIAEDGRILAESERFVIGSKMTQAVIDVAQLRHDRLHYATFHDSTRHDETRVISLRNYIQQQPDQYIEQRAIDPHPFVDSDPHRLRSRCDEISSIQAWGLAMRLRAIGCRNAVIGISGGLDSTLALLVTVKAFDMLGLDRKGITAITMPGMGTTERTHNNASKLMELLGVTVREIPIGQAVSLHFSDIGHNPELHDVTYENSQARERTQILMDVANQVNGLVIGTGDLSELALGWCTYNGDQMSMYGVNASIPKTLVKYLVEGYAQRTDNEELRKVLTDIVNTPISPELLPPGSDDSIEQKTEDLVGPYELHDFFLYHMMRYGATPTKIYHMAAEAFKENYSPETILHWLRTFYKRFFAQQFKRSCMPDGVKVGNVCLSPRGDWRMPSDSTARLWLKEIDNIEI